MDEMCGLNRNKIAKVQWDILESSKNSFQTDPFIRASLIKAKPPPKPIGDDRQRFDWKSNPVLYWPISSLEIHSFRTSPMMVSSWGFHVKY